MRINCFADIVRIHGRERPEMRAFEFEGRSLSYGALDKRSSQAANGLRAAGVSEQQHFAYLGMNTPEYFELLFGASKVNAVMTPINWRLAPGEIAEIINDIEAKALFVGPELIETVEEIEAKLTSVRTLVVIGEHDRFESYEAFLSDHDTADPRVPFGPDDIALQLCTSGTTGRPRGVMWPNCGFPSFLPTYAERWGFTADSVFLSSLHVSHGGGNWFTLPTLLMGGQVVLHQRVDPVKILEAIPRHQVSQIVLVPAALQMLLATSGIETIDFSSLQTFFYGGAPIAESVLRRAIEVLGCDFVQVYGSAETLVLTELSAADHDPVNRPHILRSVGKPLPWAELRIVDPTTGDDVLVGSVGELWARSSQTMKGYWKQPSATAEIITEGWVHTGDAGCFDEDGYVFLKDRVKDMIVSGGANVYAAEVENTLMSHPDLVEVAVIGVPHDAWGETVKAIVVRRDSSKLTEDDLITFSRERLAHFKCPTSVDFVDVLPRNVAGKVLKNQLREPYWVVHERRIG